MDTSTLSQDSFLEALRILMNEAYLGPADPRGTWFVDNEADCGFVGMLDRVDAAQASRVFGYPSGGSIAAHAYHIRFALDLVLRAARGEPSFENAKWSESWTKTTVDDAAWKALRSELRTMVGDLTSTLVPGPHWQNPMMLTGTMGVVAHGAWHLGSVRQLISML